MDDFDIEGLKKYMQGTRFGKEFVYFDELESTNTYAKECVKAGAGEGLVVLADVQTSGRGRIGRSWESGAPGESLAMSFVVKPNLPIEKLPMLTLAVATAFRQSTLPVSDIEIKWPNDILMYGKKVCGILNELVCRDGENYVVVGIGANVSQDDFGEYDSERTSLFNCGFLIPRETLVIHILKIFEETLARIEKDGNLESIKDEYISSMAGAGEYIRVLDSASSAGDISKAKLVKEGVCLGIDSDGRLLVEDREGITAFSGGEISVRF